MKKAVFLAVLIAACFFGSCSKKDSHSNPINTYPVDPVDYVMNDTINGVMFNSVHCIASISNNVLSISAENSLTDTGFVIMEMNIPGYSGIGTYTISPSSGITANIDSAVGGMIFALYGTISVTATSPLITGTFSFTCKDSTKVTSGHFECLAH